MASLPSRGSVARSAWLLAWSALSTASALAGPGDAGPIERYVGLYCVSCHNGDEKAGGLDLDSLGRFDPSKGETTPWEKVVRRLSARQMPPQGEVHPPARETDDVLGRLIDGLDRRAADHPDPGPSQTFRRLTRIEYANAIRDLLALDVDASTLLPPDESSRGFDHITVGDLSPTFLDRAVTAAQAVSRLALGRPGRSPGGDTFRVPADVTQEEHVEGLPIGTRGGLAIPYTFPRTGEYLIRARLARDRNEHVEGFRDPAEVEFLLDRDRKGLLTLNPPRSERDHQTVDERLEVRFRVEAGPHRVGVTFLKDPSSLPETRRQPYQAHYNMHRHPRLTPALYQVSITGPIGPSDAGETPSRRAILVRRPTGPADEDDSAREILRSLIRRAYRRPATEADLAGPFGLYRSARAEGDFEAGLELAIASILVNPRFLFRIEPNPPGLAPGTVFPVDDLTLASRLSAFIWSSLPDDELLNIAEAGTLRDPGRVEAQVRRMLRDPRSKSLATRFAGQWLQFRNLESITPDLRLFPDFDDNLRQAFRRETELTFERLVEEDRSVLDLIRPGRTFLNERLARHYGIPHVQGSRFRLVETPDRGGLLRQGSVLMVTSYATRTSPVIRGKWVLETLLGTPPPPPPSDVPALKDNTVDSSLSVRDRLKAHRADPACASCHRLMDPPGFALEAFDAVGRRRTTEEGRPVETLGGLPDGSTFEGVEGLERALGHRPELFATALAEKLLTFGLGRLVEPGDAPSLRKIVRESRASGYQFSSLIVGIATSVPFGMGKAQ